MASLFEKLKAAQQQTPAPGPTSGPETEEEPEMVTKLRDIGDQHDVNPPKPNVTNEPCIHCGVGFAPDKLKEHMNSCRLKTQSSEVCPHCEMAFVDLSKHKCRKDPANQSEKETCPNCGKQFKHLSRHQCKKKVSNEELQERAQQVAAQKNKERIVDDSSLGQGDSDEDRKITSDDSVESIPPAAVEQSKKEVARHEAVDAAIKDTNQHPCYDLFLDAVFEKQDDVDLQHFTDIIAPFCEAVARENQVGYWSVVDYGKSPGLLAAKFERWVQNAKPCGIILADSSTPEVRACKEILKRYARNVIQGVR